MTCLPETFAALYAPQEPMRPRGGKARAKKPAGTGRRQPKRKGKSGTTRRGRTTPEQRAQGRTLWDKGLSLQAIADAMHLPYGSVYRWKAVEAWPAPKQTQPAAAGRTDPKTGKTWV